VGRKEIENERDRSIRKTNRALRIREDKKQSGGLNEIWVKMILAGEKLGEERSKV
jgi:hypothetical protein